MEEYHVLAYLSRIGSSFSSFRNIVFYTTESLKFFQIRKKNILSHLQMQSFAGRGTKCFFSFNIIWQPYNRWVTSVQLQYMHMFSHVMSDTGFFSRTALEIYLDIFTSQANICHSFIVTFISEYMGYERWPKS